MIITNTPGGGAPTTENVTSGNIKAGVTAKVGTSSNPGKYVNVTGTFTSDANAGAGDILSGQTAYINGNKITGSMVNQGAKTSSLNCGASYTIPAGYHNGSGIITANSLASQTSATAGSGDIVNGYTAWINGTKITGSLQKTNLGKISAIWQPGLTCTCSDGTTTMQGGTSGNYTFTIYTPGTWVVTCATDSQSFVFTKKEETCTFNVELSRVGGRIFWDNGNNGGTYHFFDSSYNEIPYSRTGNQQTDVAALQNAYYYYYTGTLTAPRFYAYDNIHNKVNSKTWGKYQVAMNMTANDIGSGKINTQTMMESTPDGTMWTWLRDTVNNKSTGGCNDWFIGCRAEINKLRSSGLVDSWFTDNHIWCSNSYTAGTDYYTWAYCWCPKPQNWQAFDGYGWRDTANGAFAFRSF